MQRKERELDKEIVRERKEEAMSLRESERFGIAALLHCERYLSISIKLQWWRVASAWGIVWDHLNLQVPANLMTPPKFNHATRAREDLMSTKWHTGVSTPANRFLYEYHMIPQCPAQQDIRVLMCRLATDCPHKRSRFHDIERHLWKCILFISSLSCLAVLLSMDKRWENDPDRIYSMFL